MEDREFITLENADGTTVKCKIAGRFSAEEKDFVALTPQDGSGDIYLYGRRELSDDPDDCELYELDDDEFETAGRALDRILAGEKETEEKL